MTANYLLLTKNGAPLPAKGNRVPNPSFEADTAGWSVFNSSCSIARTTSEADTGAASLALTSSAAGNAIAATPAGTAGIPVVPNTSYLLEMQSKAAASSRATILGHTWYDASGVQLGTTQAVGGVVNTTTGWTHRTLTTTSPASAAYLRVLVGAQSTGAAGEVHYVDAVRCTVAELQWAPEPTALLGDGSLLVARDPDVAPDDSANTVGTQVYDHGWPICRRLVSYFQDTQESVLIWPLPSGFQVNLLPGPAGTLSDDGFGNLGGSPTAVGSGTLRHLVSGDEGSNRKVAAILDMLTATTTAQRTTIVNTYTANSTAFLAAGWENLTTAAGSSNGPWTSAQKRFWQRVGLNTWLARHAVGLGFNTMNDHPLRTAVGWGLAAVTAQEHGLVGATFTAANYQTLTDPLDAVLAMPSGY